MASMKIGGDDMRLIDADALDWERIEHEHGARHEAVVDCEQMVEKAPTIDAVPVVRCKDCRNWSEMQNSAGACWRHGVIAGSWWTGTDSTDYCSFAERRGDE